MATETSTIKYIPWGFKLNCMYASIPPRFYRNLHNFNEYNAPRIDIGMLTASLFEQSIYGFKSQGPRVAEEFYQARKDDIEQLSISLLMSVGAISSPSGILFAKDTEGFKFIPQGNDVDAANWEVGKPYALFIYYGSSDSVGTPQRKGYPFFKVITATLIPSTAGTFQWNYHEIQVGRGEPQYMNRQFLAGPMFVAHFGESYTDLNFDEDNLENLAVYHNNTSYFEADASLKEPFEQLISRETISELNEYGEFTILWDGHPAHRSIVVSQPYYDWDDDLQSAQVDYRLLERLNALEDELTRLKKRVRS
jgi:hypothetical protein